MKTKASLVKVKQLDLSTLTGETGDMYATFATRSGVRKKALSIYSSVLNKGVNNEALQDAHRTQKWSFLAHAQDFLLQSYSWEAAYDFVREKAFPKLAKMIYRWVEEDPSHPALIVLERTIHV